MATPSTGSMYDEMFTSLYLPDEEYEEFNLSLDDERLSKLLIDSLDKDVNYWNKKPWNLQETDKENVAFYLGDQLNNNQNIIKQLTGTDQEVDNCLLDAVRAILSYATGQLAMPEITPSKSDEQYIKMARSIQMALYQHSLNEQTDQLFRTALLNLIIRKRAYLKLRYDPHAGLFGDVVTEHCDPSDIIIDREARYHKNPNRIYHRVRKSIEEWCELNPNKADDIYRLFGFKRGTANQLSRIAPGFEGWFTYRDRKGIPREAVAWFLTDPGKLIIDKGPNPNWVYTGDDKKDKEENVLFAPPKPFVSFNFLNLGHSYIDETSLFDQAKPLQKIYNDRYEQLQRNASLVNGRWVASRKALKESDGVKMINKGAKTVTMVDAEDVGKAVVNLGPQNVIQPLLETINDLRNQIDRRMGTPSIFRGSNPTSKDTLGRDMMLKQQAGMLQDDLVRCVQFGYQDYYQIKLQMFRTYFTEDYWFNVKGGDGKYDFIMLNGDTIDSNVRIGVETDSTLPLDKAMIRDVAKELLTANKIDYLTAMEDMGLPDPDIRTERYLRSQIDLYTYMQSIETQLDSNDAEVDIMLLKAGRTPEERDNYDENYLNYFNNYVTKNEFQRLPQNTQQKLVVFLQEVTQRAQKTAQLGQSLLNQAGIINRPPIMPLPKRTENIRIDAMTSPQMADTLAQGEAKLAIPASQLEQAQSPDQQGGSPVPPM